MVDAKDLGLWRGSSGRGCRDANGGNGSGLGAFFGHVDHRAVHDLIDRKPSLRRGPAGHAAEIGAIGIEREQCRRKAARA
jgi:hypothetical protein